MTRLNDTIYLTKHKARHGLGSILCFGEREVNLPDSWKVLFLLSYDRQNVEKVGERYKITIPRPLLLRYDTSLEAKKGWERDIIPNPANKKSSKKYLFNFISEEGIPPLKPVAVLKVLEILKSTGGFCVTHLLTF